MRKRYHIGPGAASLVMIVVILSLTILGILTWTSARSDLRLSQRDGEMEQGYYQADAQAQRVLFQIDQALMSGREGALDFADYLARLDGLLPDGVIRRGDELSYRQDAGAQRVVQVTLRIAPLEQGARYQVMAWQLEDHFEWEEPESVKLLGMG